MKKKEEIKIITANWGEVDPKDIESYIRQGGYKALEKFVSKMDSQKALKEIKKSGLCGRGGAGFPTGEKLAQVADNPSKTKYFICNLDESEPGTYKDRLIVENDPHLLLEGVILAALTIGAKKAYIYINGNYEKQADILSLALEQAREKKFLGRKILKSSYSLEIEVFPGAGAYICGEETALLNSIEGKRGEPRMRPPFPTQAGLFGKPTAINNAETVASLPWIILHGGKKYSEIGSKTSPGTKLFILGGAVRNPGIFELPTGTTLKKLLNDYGLGLKKGKKLWFVQLGGAAGRLVPEKKLNLKLEYDRTSEFPLGSGAVLVVDRSVDIHEMLMSWTDFFHRESCGKCVPCREGTFRLFEIAKRLRDGEISDRDKQAVEDILWTLKNTTFCPLGFFAATAFSDAWGNYQEEILNT